MKRKMTTVLLSLTIILNSITSYALGLGVVEKIGKNNIVSMEEKNTFEKLFTFSELNVYKEEEIYMIPLRPVLERLGYEVRWNNKLKQVDISKDMKMASLKQGEEYYFLDKDPIKLSKAPENKNGVTYVPLEFFKIILDEHIILTGENVGIYKTEVTVEEKETLDLIGYIKNIREFENNKSILTSIDNKRSEMPIGELSLHIFEDTQIKDLKDKPVKFEDLNVGDKVEMETPRYMTMSLPAQTTLRNMVVEPFVKFEEIDASKDEMKIKYPSLEFEKNKAVESLFNQKMEDYITSVKENPMFFDIDLNYNFSLISEDIVSVIFRGKFHSLGKEKDLIKVMNINMKDGKEIDYDNYFKDDFRSRNELKRILNREVRKGYSKEFEAEGIFIYFTENNIVLYYYELDDSAVVPIEIYLNYDEIENLVK